MPLKRDSGSSDAPPPSSAEEPQSAPATSRGDQRLGFLWPVLFGSVLVLLAGTFVVLWPVFKAAGAAVALGMALALVVVSLAPLIVLRKTVNRMSGPHVEDHEGSE